MKAYVLINVKQNKVDEVMEDVTRSITVNSITNVYGAYDIIVELEDTNKSELLDSIFKIKKIYNIRSVLVLFDTESDV